MFQHNNLEDILLSEVHQTQKDNIMYDSTFMSYIEWPDSWRQKAGWWLPGAKGMGAGGGEERGVSLMGTEF